MSTHSSTDTTTAPVVGGDPSTDQHRPATALEGRPGVPFSRTLQAELRKIVDTRAGLWMVVVMVGLAAVVLAAAVIWGSADDSSFNGLLQLATLPLATVLPILGIMAATAEWSQRTGLVTFALEPRRGRVVLAKAVASMLFAVLVLVVAVAASAFVNVVAGTGEWDLTAAVAGGLFLAMMLYVLQGVAFGLVFLNTPISIVAVLVLPSIWGIATQLIGRLETIGEWVNLDRVMVPLFAGEMGGQEWAQLATGVAAWVLLPLAIGTYRVLNREVK
ncbi:ABC transporter permease [Nocardioides hwasunensis]|uniref:ABC transporter permease n=1 Tax=Nocardioides hwasunensis TaxID=397258 RepID=A0ABR8MIU1_9ACTN|nr:ABC transporter permease [Nocardioides hwasunensis]MBD3915972.1 ABC transporter permease [Nocardioides hwasunensis]